MRSTQHEVRLSPGTSTCTEGIGDAVAARMTHEFFIGSIIGIEVTSDFTE
jgi:hypothetical protein